jgi:hypothetical protein
MMFLTLHSPKAKEIAIDASQKMQRVIDRLPEAKWIAVQTEYAI